MKPNVAFHLHRNFLVKIEIKMKMIEQKKKKWEDGWKKDCQQKIIRECVKKLRIWIMQHYYKLLMQWEVILISLIFVNYDGFFFWFSSLFYDGWKSALLHEILFCSTDHALYHYAICYAVLHYLFLSHYFNNSSFRCL